MSLYALSDLHVSYARNRAAIEELASVRGDGLILAGDLAESAESVAWVLDTLRPAWKQLFWVPGNHELWTSRDGLRGEAKYARLVEVCRERGVHTPEDPYVPWGDDLVICPMFLGYDYSFCPEGMTPDEAVAWAAEDGIRCTDEHLLDPAPFPTRRAWCASRVAYTARRLATEVPADRRTVLINHWPLRIDLVRTYKIPRFLPWCGTTATHDWHTRFRAAVVVSGHLHMRATDWRDGVRFEEVSLGYPRHWDGTRSPAGYLREILPGPAAPPGGEGGPIWHR